MKVIAISGSPVEGGNTETALQAILESAEAAGAESEFVRLYDLDMAPCDGCDACTLGGGCALDDDATALIDRMAEADALVFGTPVYWYHVSGVFKNLADRTYSASHQKDLAGKRVVAVMVQHSSGADETVRLFEHWCEDQECTLVEAVTIDTESEPGVVSGDAALLRRLRGLGERLAP